MIKSKMSVIAYLMENTKQEMKLLEDYNEHRIKNLGRSMEDRVLYHWPNKTPSKQLIKDNLKMIRRVSMEIEKEIDGYYGQAGF